MIPRIDPRPDFPDRGSASSPLTWPRPPQPPERRGFPLIATFAPVLGSVVLWVVTRSPYVLVFALLGPLVAIASIGDSALQGRRKRSTERARFAADVAASDAAITREHEAERSELVARYRALQELQRGPARDAERWRATLDAGLPIVAGSGAVVSRLSADANPRPSTEAREFAAQLDALRDRAGVLPDAPVVVDARLGIGVCGPTALASSVARGLVLQLANQLSPAGHEIVAAAQGEEWLATLPHPIVEPRARPDAIVFRARGTGTSRSFVMVAIAETADELPRDCRTVLSVATVSSARLRPVPAGVLEGQVAPEFVSREQARSFAAMLARAAESAGLAEGVSSLPDDLALATLYPALATPQAPGSGARRDSLECTPVAAASGAVTLDLVRDGPHAIIGGTTGSGKSELLIAWVLAMAASHSPSAVTFLLVDFKGGSSFSAVRQLPHCVGLITDLDESSARRALTSLRAELRYRERALAAAGARSIEQLPQQHPLARLVIVVDEFAAMVQDFPELHELFADIAARGRSLGVHLILCTQRPAGVVRDAILANCTLRISLRVTNAADSSAVIGSAAAAELPRLPLGRALLCVAGEEARAVQVALAREEDSAGIERRWAAVADEPPRRPWCDPPADVVRLAELDGGAAGDGIVFGLVDLPQEQRLDLARYSPREQGGLMVIGGHHSGKSGLLDVLAADDHAGCVRVPRDQEGAWDVLVERLAAVRRGDTTPVLLLIDDLDALLGSFSEEYSHALSEVVTAILREGGRAATHLVITARRLGPGLQSIAALCDSRLVLRMPDKQEHVAAGGEARDFDARLRPGAGYWGGHRVQLAVADERPSSSISREVEVRDWGRWGGLLVVAAHPGKLLRRLGADAADEAPPHIRGLPGWRLETVQGRSTAELTALSLDPAGEHRLLIADPETWQSQWGVFGALRARLPILFDGCGTADFRALSRLRALPPPIAPGSAAVWLLTPDGRVERATPPWAAAQ
ncbi:MAG TPA: FtsK/SpoIIIE domain-containing protein [Lacisediminihabitans sp.]|nr:FtsK/SpoIIIE domain-containing protein [Lacisediminihabitans sp.]HXD61599.1 FtsK/SpoIIIE domain-containing protein [Lacisediminihabitans sp.]